MKYSIVATVRTETEVDGYTSAPFQVHIAVAMVFENGKKKVEFMDAQLYETKKEADVVAVELGETILKAIKKTIAKSKK